MLAPTFSSWFLHSAAQSKRYPELAGKVVPRSNLEAQENIVLGLLINRMERSALRIASSARVRPGTIDLTLFYLELDGFVSSRPHDNSPAVFPNFLFKITDKGILRWENLELPKLL